MPSVHSIFVQDAKVINTRPQSQYFGHRGTVYGSGPTRNGVDLAGVIWVRMDTTGDCKKFLPSRLALLPKPETEYRVSNRTRSGRTVTVHEVPAERHRRPSLEQLVEAMSSES